MPFQLNQYHTSEFTVALVFPRVRLVVSARFGTSSMSRSLSTYMYIDV